MGIVLTQTEHIHTFTVEMDGSNIEGEITNRTQGGEYKYKPGEFGFHLTSSDLRAVADELDRLNKK